MHCSKLKTDCDFEVSDKVFLVYVFKILCMGNIPYDVDVSLTFTLHFVFPNKEPVLNLHEFRP